MAEILRDTGIYFENSAIKLLTLLFYAFIIDNVVSIGIFIL